MSSYIELHARSAFSFLEGASSPERLVEQAARLGYPALALLEWGDVGRKKTSAAWLRALVLEGMWQERISEGDRSEEAHALLRQAYGI